MTPQEIPEFIFRGAVLNVKGREETVVSLSLETPVVTAKNGLRQVAPDQVLYLKFKSGLEMEYDSNRVFEIPGRAPDFIHKGARIFCRSTPGPNKRGAGFSTALNGVWEVASHKIKSGELQVVLKRPSVDGGGDVYLSRAFNAKSMFPVSPDSPLPMETPAYQLENPVPVRKSPVRFRPTQAPKQD